MFIKYPAVLFGCGDLIAQKLEKQDLFMTHFEPNRTLKLMTFGGLVAGPSIATWYKLLDKIKFKTPLTGEQRVF